jgi:ADP-heptose:LPS heptosyltransferase
MSSLIGSPEKIIILRALQLGDLLCAVPAFRALRAAYPQAGITLVGLPWAEDFVRRFSHYLDDFIAFPGWPGLPEQEPAMKRIPGFLEAVQARSYDLALQMQGSGTLTNPLVALFGARQTAGYYLTGQYRPQEALFPVYPEEGHEIHVWLELMGALGILSQGEHLEFPVHAEERAAFEQMQSAYGLEPGRYICLHPGARDTARRWPPEQFAHTGDYFAKQGFQLVLTGSQAEKDLTGAVRAHMQAPATDLAGKTGLGVLALLIAHARLLISNDTGVSHVAAACQTPSVVLFSVSNPSRWQPLNHNLHRAVMNFDQASPEDVLNESRALLQEERVNGPTTA